MVLNEYPIIFIAFLLLTSNSINAGANTNCSGTLTYLNVAYDGSVYIHGSWRNEHVKIFTLAQGWKNVPAETCKGWLSLVEIAKASNSKIMITYDGNEVGSCSEIPSYGNAPRPDHIALIP